MAVIAGTAAANRRGTMIGLAASLSGLSLVVGPALGGYLAPAAGVEVAFLVAGAFGVAIFAGLLLPGWAESRVGHGIAPTRLLADALRSPLVLGSMACALVIGLVGGAAQTLAPLRLNEGGFSAGDIGTVLIVGASLGLLGTAVVGRLVDVRGVAVVAGVWAILIPLLAFGLALGATPWIAALFLAALLPLLRVGGSIGFSLGAEHAALGAGLATSYGLLEVAWSAGAIVGPLSAGAVADAWSEEAGLIAAAIGAALLVPLVAAPWRRYAREECAVG
jgi:predicted MFS family arabinose efflux permease